MISIVKHQAVIALLVTILSNFSDCDYCPASAPTVSVVSKCPTNKTEWDQAASRKKCSHMSAKCGDKSPVYHCLLNQWGNETVEVCASTWYISGFCAIYNTDEMKVIDDFGRDCTAFSEGNCPTRYISSEAYLYQKCYMKKSSNTIPLPDRSIGIEETNDCIMSTVIAIIVTVLVLAITSLVVFITLRLKISKKAPDEECMLFCNATTQIVEECEEKTLLKENEPADTSGVECSKPLLCIDDLQAKYETADTSGVECSNLPGVHVLQAKYGGGKARVQTPNERVTNSSYAKPKDKENGVQKGTFLKELEQKLEHTTENDVNFTSRGNLDNLDNKEDIDIDHVADKANAAQKDVKQKAGHTIQNDVDCSSHGNLINEEKNDDEREKSPDPSPTDYDSAVDTEIVAHNVISEVDQKVDHVDFPSVCNSTKEDEYEDEKTQSPDSTSRESVTNTTNATSTDSDAAETEKSLRNEEVHQSVDINEGRVSVHLPGRVQSLKENLEKREIEARGGGKFHTPNARTTRSAFGNT